MDDLRSLLNEVRDFLVYQYNFTTKNESDLIVELESKELRLKIIMEKNSMYFDFQNISNDDESDWYDLDIVKNCIENPSSYRYDLIYSEIDNPYDLKQQVNKSRKEVNFIKENINEIFSVFSNSNIIKNIQIMKKLRNERAKMILG